MKDYIRFRKLILGFPTLLREVWNVSFRGGNPFHTLWVTVTLNGYSRPQWIQIISVSTFCSSCAGLLSVIQVFLYCEDWIENVVLFITWWDCAFELRRGHCYFMAQSKNSSPNCGRLRQLGWVFSFHCDSPRAPLPEMVGRNKTCTTGQQKHGTKDVYQIVQNTFTGLLLELKACENLMKTMHLKQCNCSNKKTTEENQGLYKTIPKHLILYRWSMPWKI